MYATMDASRTNNARGFPSLMSALSRYIQTEQGSKLNKSIIVPERSINLIDDLA